MNLDDKSLFLDAMEDVQPLKRATDVHWHPTRNQRAPQRIDTLQLDNFLTTGFLDIIPLSQPLEFRREGLQHGVLDKLRSGKYPQQASLNLLRQPVEECRKMMFSFIQQAMADGLRNVLIIHGKGRDDKSHANIVRSYVARWLTEFDDVQAYCTALPIMAAAGRVTSHYVKRRRRSKKTGSATLSAAVDLETHPRLMPPARGCVHHFSPDTKHHQRV